jgi:soluble lytic murein transglycosylase-like protein
MAKVIDALVVTLGLDPSGYKKGAADAKAAQDGLKQSAESGATSTVQATEKAGAAQTKQSKALKERDREEKKRRRDKERADRQASQEEQKHADATIERIKGIGFAVAGAVLGFNTLKGALQSYAGATNQLANLGRVAPTIGTDVKALDKLGDAYKMVGGKADEAGSDIAKLSHAQFSFAINAPDAMAGWARRLGVSLFDQKGNPRDKIAIQEEIAASLKRQTSDLQTQAMYAREMGLSESFIQLYLVKQSSERAKILQDAEKTAQATADGAKAAQAQEQAVSRVKNRLKEIGQNIVTAVSPSIARTLNAVVDAGDSASATSGERTLKYLGLADKGPSAKRIGPTKYDAAFAAAERKYHLPQGLLKGIAHRESNFDPNAVSPAGAKGLMQLMPKYFPNAGKNANADIDSAAAELSRLYQYYRRMYATQEALKLAIGAYNAGQGKMGNAISGKIDPKTGKPTELKQETKEYVPAVTSYMNAVAASSAPSAGAAGATTTVNTHIEQLNVHTQATDAPGIAATLPDAIRRQNLVAQGNSGLQ